MLRNLMITSSLMLATALTPFAANAADAVPAYITAAVTVTSRPTADTARDADRKPAECLALAEVKPGQQIVDFVPGGGYFTRIFSKAVGPTGHVTALSLMGSPDKYVAPSKAIAADAAYANVTAVVQKVADLPPGSVDLFWTAQNYHDLHNIKGADLAALDKSILAALKPGGIFLVIDHSAPAGSGFADTDTLHRIDEKAVVAEIEAAGFKLEKTSDLLRNPKDPRTAVVFDPSIKGKTDQFILKFRKPS